MSVSTQISRIEIAKDKIRQSIINKGINIPVEEKIDTYSTYIDRIVTLQESLGTIYPIGIIVPFYDNEDRSSWLGFTWERCLQSRFPVGVSSGDSDFGTVGKTGGERTHALTSAEAPPLSYDSKSIGIGSGTDHASGYSGSNGSPHNNLPPYEVVSYWRRTS